MYTYTNKLSSTKNKISMKKIIKCSILTMMAASTFSFMNNQSPLNKLISNKAFSKSVVENFSSEIMTDSMLTQITLLSLNSHDMSPIYMMLPVYIGLAINNSKIDKNKQDKIEKIELYRARKKIFRHVTFVLLAIFMKNVDAAV
jgi:hypothetical protein